MHIVPLWLSASMVWCLDARFQNVNVLLIGFIHLGQCDARLPRLWTAMMGSSLHGTIPPES